MTRLTASLLLVTLTVASAYPSLLGSVVADETLSCAHYAQANTESATCSDRPNVVCSQKCTGGVVVDGCSSAQSSSAALTRQTCTIAFNQASTTNSTCVNAQGSFSCSGVPSGQATCSGCAASSSPLIPVIGTLGGSAATLAPQAPAGPTPVAPIITQNNTISAPIVKANLTLPSAPAAAIGVVAPPSIQAVSPPANKAAKSNNTTSPTIVYLTEGEAPEEDDNSTSIASSRYSKNSAPLVVTLGFMAVGFVAL
ncbi:hypothetical protein Pst134EA_000495 [Puccinia striiformis f. sp. tritici]|uniref:hypothetical protein n=1 Tax=Puccinia striiformis f. sp. tritici TaxID=168172 RepID=UPI0020076D95|nr:hypothetical protein Pst134EA_000495 [Puccinia striiformis f. sp. tritici]KAH9473424.1 hypothetical protein Pst134EA_000495 [Puccinia striiformis f. sp. tritici]